MAAPVQNAEGEGEEQAEPGQIGTVADMLEEAQLFERAGLGFGEKETFLLYTAIKKLCQVKAAGKCKFWGKIFAQKRDYYIVEATVEGGEEGEIPPTWEPKGAGINKMIYFVTSNRKFFFLQNKSYG